MKQYSQCNLWLKQDVTPRLIPLVASLWGGLGDSKGGTRVTMVKSQRNWGSYCSLEFIEIYLYSNYRVAILVRLVSGY